MESTERDMARFDKKKLMLSGTVPNDAPDKILVVFTMQDEIKGTTGCTQMNMMSFV